MESNSSIKSLMKLIQKICDENLKKRDCITSGVINSVNQDGTVNLYIPPDYKVFTNIPNQCPFELNPGDTVKLMKEKGRASNMWVIAKCGASYVDVANYYLDINHPVGSLYWSTDPTNPHDLFGGTWERIKDRMILAVGDQH